MVVWKVDRPKAVMYYMYLVHQKNLIFCFIVSAVNIIKMLLDAVALVDDNYMYFTAAVVY